MKKYISLFAATMLAAGMLAGCSAPEEEGAMATSTEQSTTVQESVAEQTTTVLQESAVDSTTKAGQSAQSIISEEQAKKIAFNDAGVKESDVTGSRVRLEMDDGRQEYEVDFYVGNREYDYTIAADNGDILEKDSDIDNDFNISNNKNNNSNSIISRKKAINIVLDQVKGASESDVRIHLDSDDGRQTYEGSVVFQEKEYDFEIDASTGNILEWEVESIYD